MSMEIGDVLGFGKASEKLLDVVSKACGALYRPTGIRREAAAKAEEVRLLGTARTAVEAEKIRQVGLAEAEKKLLAADADIEILERAKARLVAREIQRQSNIEAIAGEALRELPSEVSEEPVEDNWRTRFFNIAEDISDADMQKFWGKVLAGEVAKPGTYSLRTLEILRNLSRNEAEAFQRFCALVFGGGFAIKLEDTRPRGKLFIPHAPSADFKDFGVPYADILVLQAAGLVSYGDDLSTTFRYTQGGDAQDETKAHLLLEYNELPVVLRCPTGTDITLPAALLTPSGVELRKLIPNMPNPAYLRRVAEGLKVRGIDMYRPDEQNGTLDIKNGVPF